MRPDKEEQGNGRPGEKEGGGQEKGEEGGRNRAVTIGNRVAIDLVLFVARSLGLCGVVDPQPRNIFFFFRGALRPRDY